MSAFNRQWRLVARPDGLPRAEHWRLETGPVPEPGEGQIVARACWLSVDPYMRGRIAAGPSYARPVEPGEVMQGGGVGVVVASRLAGFKPGDIVGPCGVSDDPNWKSVTRDGKDPLKCMPRQKAHDTPRSERADLAREKMRAERDEGNRGKKPTRTPTFDKKAGDNEPTDPDLWEESKDEARKRYTKWPSAYAVGHALKLYKDEGGGWRKKKAEYDMPRKFDRAHCESKTCDEMGFSEKA